MVVIRLQVNFVTSLCMISQVPCKGTGRSSNSNDLAVKLIVSDPISRPYSLESKSH